jgi:cell division transport system permease protein
MKLLRKLRWVLATTGKSLWRNRGTAAAGAVVIATTLSMSGVALLLEQQISLLQGHWQDKIDLSVYLCTEDSVAARCAGAPASRRVEELRDTISALDGVEEVYFEDRESAYAEFSKRFAGTDIARSIGKSALPESFRIRISDGAEREALMEAIRGERDVELVQDQREMLQGFFRAVGKIRVAALGFAAAQAFGAAVILIHLVRGSLRRRHREVRIMDLMGARRRMIRAPFILEVVAVTVTGAVLAAGVLVTGVASIGPSITSSGELIARTVTVHEAGRTGATLAAVAGGVSWLLSRLTLRANLRAQREQVQ